MKKIKLIADMLASFLLLVWGLANYYSGVENNVYELQIVGSIFIVGSVIHATIANQLTGGG